MAKALKAPLKSPRKVKEKNSNGRWMILIFFLLLGASLAMALFALSPTKPRRRASPISAYSPQADQLVNKHLSMTSQQLNFAQQKTQAENSFLAPQIGDSIWPKIESKKSMGVDHSADRNEDNAFQDLNRYRQDLRLNNPDEIIQGQLQDEDVQKAEMERRRQEYAAQFVENARQHGYQVQLNEDFVVTGVRPLRNPSATNPRLFDSTGPVGSGPQAK